MLNLRWIIYSAKLLYWQTHVAYIYTFLNCIKVSYAIKCSGILFASNVITVLSSQIDSVLTSSVSSSMGKMKEYMCGANHLKLRIPHVCRQLYRWTGFFNWKSLGSLGRLQSSVIGQMYMCILSDDIHPFLSAYMLMHCPVPTRQYTIKHDEPHYPFEDDC